MITSRGIILLISSLLLIGIGLVRIDGPLMTLGILGILTLTLTKITAHLNLRNLSLELIAPPRIYAETLFDFRLILKNHRRLTASRHLRLHLKLCQDTPLELPWPLSPPSSRSERKTRNLVKKRGNATEHPYLLSSTFPLGLWHHQHRGLIKKPLLICPKAQIPNELYHSGDLDDAWSGEGSQIGNSPGEPRGLRPHQPGDPAKMIHWPSSIRALARGRSLRVREFDPPGQKPAHLTVLFHSFGTDNTLIRTDLFEQALALLCGTLRHLRKLGLPTTLLADFLHWQKLPTTSRTAMSDILNELARARRANHTEAHDLTSEITHLPKSEALIIISDMPLTSWEHLLPTRPAILIDIAQRRPRHQTLTF